MGVAPIISDYFAELYIAGLLAEAKWEVYFPKRDVGFDMIATRQAGGKTIIRPIQVKGKYPQSAEGRRKPSGYSGKLTRIHSDMALVIPYFDAKVAAPDDKSTEAFAPRCIAWLPLSSLKDTKKGFRCFPATTDRGRATPIKTYRQYFDAPGLKLMEGPTWGRRDEPIPD